MVFFICLTKCINLLKLDIYDVQNQMKLSLRKLNVKPILYKINEKQLSDSTFFIASQLN